MSTKKDSGLVISGSLVKKIGESLGLVKLMLARKLQSLVPSLYISVFNSSVAYLSNSIEIDFEHPQCVRFI